jgi:hypothetical protein
MRGGKTLQFPATGERLQVSNAPEKARGQRQSSFCRALDGHEPAIKGMMIYANP